MGTRKRRPRSPAVRRAVARAPVPLRPPTREEAEQPVETAREGIRVSDSTGGIAYVLPQGRDRLVQQLVAAQEAERLRIARELHDQTGQHLVALSLGLARLPDLDDAAKLREIRRLQDVVDVLSVDVQRLASQLRPAALDHLGLAVAVSSYVETVAAHAGLDIDVHAADLSSLNLDKAVETAVYRIVQEAVTNVVRHAQARQVSILLETRDGDLQVIVEDDGRGFVVTHDHVGHEGRQRLGLAGMHERAALAGGTLRIESAPGHGTSVYLVIPGHARVAGASDEQSALTTG